MMGRRNGRFYECVTIDLNTQSDYCDPNGANPVANLQEFIPALRRVIAWTKRNCAPVVSSLESHRPRDVCDMGHPVRCVDGSNGQRKVPFTMFPCHARIEVDNTLALPLDLFHQHQQVLFRLRTDDLLVNPKADRFLTQLPTAEFIVYGNAAEWSVKAVVLGLLAREKEVTVVQDACGYWHQAKAELAFRQMAAKGAVLSTVDELLARKLTRRHRYPSPGPLPAPSPATSTNRRTNGNGNGNGNGRLPPSLGGTRIRKSNNGRSDNRA